MTRLAPGVEVSGPTVAGQERLLSPAAVSFLADLERRFRDERLALLRRRADRHTAIAAGRMPEFLPETAERARGRLAGRARADGPGRPAGRDHRPGRARR